MKRQYAGFKLYRYDSDNRLTVSKEYLDESVVILERLECESPQTRFLAKLGRILDSDYTYTLY